MAKANQIRPAKILYFDDLYVGQRFTSGTYLIDEEMMKAFATQFDPQPFHLDAAAAKATLFEGLVASGWHIAAITMRLLVENLPIAGGVIGAGGDIGWPKPTRAGTVLHVESEILELRLSRSRPSRGWATIRSETRSQAGEILQVLVAKLVVPRHPDLMQRENATVTRESMMATHVANWPSLANANRTPDELLTLLPESETGHADSLEVAEHIKILDDEIDDRYSVRRIAPSDTAAMDRPSDSSLPGAELSSWVAEANGETIGSISIVIVDNDTVRLEQFHVTPAWEADRRLARRLARTAADSARELGLSKLVIDVPEDLPGLPRQVGVSPAERAAEAESRVRTYVEKLGFVFSRKREFDGNSMLEFYLDLYRYPLIEPSATK